MALQDRYDIATNSMFLERVTMAVVTNALLILAEFKGSFGNVEWFKRSELAHKLLQVHTLNDTLVSGLEVGVPIFASAIAANPAIGDSMNQMEVDDVDILAEVLVVWDALAGVTERDLET